MWGREEALYQLAVSDIDAGKWKLAVPHLKRASNDGDYPEADAVLKQIRSKAQRSSLADVGDIPIRAFEGIRSGRFIGKRLGSEFVEAVTLFRQMSLSFSPLLVLTFVALLLGSSQRVQCAQPKAPTFKLSDSGICQIRGSSSYLTTLHFQSFETLAECINAGGRLPKTDGRKTSDMEEPPAASIEPHLKENSGVVVIRSIPSRDIAMGAVLVIAFGILVAFIRFRARRYPRVHLKRASQKQGDPPPSSISADERRLLKACLGSSEVAERLIQFERERNPALSRRRAAAAAVRRIARDNK